MRTITATVGTIAAAIGVAALVVMGMVRETEDPSEQIYIGTYSGLNMVMQTAAKPSCCALMWTFANLNANSRYSIRERLRRCKLDRRSRNCTKSCSKMWTSQGCKACCDFKAAMGVFRTRPNSKSLCKKVCRRAFACRFSEGPRVANVKCGFGKCRQLSKNHKCVKGRSRSVRKGYCECVKDIPQWLRARLRNW